MNPEPRYFRAYLAAAQLLYILNSTDKSTLRLLDIGGAHGIHSRFFNKYGIISHILDLDEGDEPLSYKGDYLSTKINEQYDIIWSSHVLEHISNVGLFLSKIYSELKIDGYAVITVPPIRENKMAYEHVTLWNCGLLLLNMAYAGFNPKNAHLARYGYNISIIAKKTDKKFIPTIKNLNKSFPKGMRTTEFHMKGNIKKCRWTVDNNFLLSNYPEFKIITIDNKKKLFYYDSIKNEEFRCM